MSLSNIRDSMVKNQFVGDIHARAGEAQRSQDAAAMHAHREQARQAEEVVVQLSQAADQNAVREDEDGRRGREEREEEERKPHEPPEEEEEPGPPNVGSHRLDITA